MIKGKIGQNKEQEFEFIKVKTNKDTDAYIQNRQYYFRFERLNL